MGMELGWSRDRDGATVESPGSSAPCAAGDPCGTEGDSDTATPRVTAETGRGDTAELPAQSLLPRGFSIPTCWQEGCKGHRLARGGLKSGSPPYPTDLGLWQ